MNTHLLRRRAATAAISALLVSGLAACGGNDNGSPFQAGDASTPATSSEATSSAAPTSDGGAAGSAISTDEMAQLLKDSVAKLDTAHATTTMSISAGGQDVAMTSEADIQSNPMAASMTVSMSGMEFQEILVDGVMYMKSPGLTGGKWAKLDMSALGGALGGGALSQTFTNPMAMMDQMADYLSSATYVGDESVGGASAKHYRMTIDFKSAMAKMAPNMGQTAQLPDTTTEDIWLDSEGRPVKTVVEMGALGKMTTTMSDFGKTVHITAPPASEVTTMPGMPGMGG